MKYLYYDNYCSGHSGLSNSIMSIEIAVILAFLTDRVLVLDGNVSPSANVVQYRDVITNAHRSRITDLLDIPVPWIEAEAIDISGFDSRELTNKRLGKAVFYHPPTIDTSAPDFKAFAHTRRHFLSYTDAFRNASVLKLSGGPPVEPHGFKLFNLCFYSYLFYLDGPTRESVHGMLRGMHPKPHFTAFADRLVKDLGAFNAVHIRRGDFKRTVGVTTLERRPQEVIEILEHHFDRNDRLVILTDEQDDPFFDEITDHYRDHIFLDRHILDNYRQDFLDLPYHDSIALAFLAQLIAAAAQDFVGTMTSTFTALIQRYRGNRGMDEQFKFLWNELPDEGAAVEPGRHAISDGVPMRHGIMVEEHAGPYSWNRYNPRINPAWMREWPEAFLSATAAKAPHKTGTTGAASARVNGASHPAIKSGAEHGERAEPLYVTFGAHQVALSIDDPETLKSAQASFRAMLEQAPRHVVGELRVTSQNGQHRLIPNGDDALAVEADSYRMLYPELSRAIVHHFIQVNPDLIWLHAGAAAQAGRTVVIAGPWGRGKSTLVTRLYEQGWRYHSDDILPLDPAAGTVLPFPQTPRMRNIGDQVLSRENIGGMHKTAIDLDLEAVAREPAPLGMLVLPIYDPKTTAQLTPHPPSLAVAELLESCISYVKHRETVISTLCELVQELPTFRLKYNDGQRAAELIAEAHAGLFEPAASSSA